MEKTRIVVTGMGAVTPVGNTAQEFWQGLMASKSGAGIITKFDASDYDTKFACEVKNFNPLDYMDRKIIQRMDLFTQYAYAGAEMALRDAGITTENVDGTRVGVVVGSGIGGMASYETQQRTVFETGGPHRISPFFVPMMISDIAAGYISMRYKFKGPNYATTSACATSSHAIADSVMLMERGMVDVMITGGAEAVIRPMGVGGFNAMKALSTRNDAPEKASRPFDKERDGFVIGEGGGILVLETLDHAVKRGARIYAEITGIGLTGDAHHITQPAPGGEGAVRSMRMAMADGGIEPTAIDYINVHGTSTPLGDISESDAIKTVFGEHAYKLNISSTKSMTGHLLGAAGAIEAIASIWAIVHQMIPPTINYEVPDPACDLNYTPNKPVKRTVNYAISNTFGFGGHNATLLFKRFVD